MKITWENWLILIVLAIVGFMAWFQFGYPQFFFVNLSVDKQEAQRIAESYLSSSGADTQRYLKAVVFVEDSDTDRYLQKTLGFKGEGEFLRKYNYDLFFWSIRFFRVGQKEEYVVMVSSKKREVIGFRHSLEDTEARIALSKNVSKRKAEEFLAKNFKTNFSELDFHEEKIRKLEKRTDYSFSWENKGVYIPWSDTENGGGAKLIIGATIAGNEVIGFYNNYLQIPEKFGRFMEKQLAAGQYIGSISFILMLIMICWAVFLLAWRRNDVIMHISKPWYFGMGIALFVLLILSILNNFQNLLYEYNTSTSLVASLGQYFISVVPNILFLSVVFMLPGLTGESLRQEAYPDKKQISFFHFVNSTFWCRTLSRMIILGYLLFIMLIGLQAALFSFGQKYFGVWVERLLLVDMSSSYLPFLAALVIGSRASLNEEVLFRLFGITWGKKYLKSTILALLVTSVIWGFCHSEYAIFPIWFRGVEVSTMGLLLGFMFLRYGIITVVVAHYVFDVFWGVAPYLLGRVTPYLFYSSLFAILLPLFIAIIAYLINGKEEERPLAWLLNKHQKFNLEVLINFLKDNKKHLPAPEKLKEELISHGWDVSVVELAIKMAYYS